MFNLSANSYIFPNPVLINIIIVLICVRVNISAHIVVNCVNYVVMKSFSTKFLFRTKN